MLIYDLPQKEADQRREYREFRRELLKMGFMQLQESVYVKLMHNSSSLMSGTKGLLPALPSEGSVMLLPMSLNVFRSMLTLQGEGFNMSLFSDDILWL